MGKASRRKNSVSDPLNLDKKVISRVIRRLNLPDSRGSYEDFCALVAPIVGWEEVAKWEVFDNLDADARYDFTYSSLERARIFAVGWRSWPLEVECAWMLPRLRDALSRHDENSQFLVEIGAGPGAAGAVLSAALNVPVIAVDPHPLTEGMAEQLAAMTRGVVTSHVAGAEDLPAVLGGRTPAAVFGMGVFRYFQPHLHGEEVFSYTNSISRYLRDANPSQVSRDFFDSIAPADLLLSEQCCTDYVGEVAAGAFACGYQAVSGGIAELKVAVPGEELLATAMHFALDHPHPSTGSLLAEMFSPLPGPRSGFVTTSRAAEPLRLSLQDAETIRASETIWADGSGTLRREAFRIGTLFGFYFASDRNFRKIQFFRSEDWQASEEEELANDRAMVDSGYVEVRPLLTPVTAW